MLILTIYNVVSQERKKYMNQFDTLFGGQKALIGMVHLLALPGTNGFTGDMKNIVKTALDDAQALEKGGMNALLIENFGDAPFAKKLTEEQLAALAAAAAIVGDKAGIPVGIDAAFCDYKAAIACAKASQAKFVRLSVYVDTMECTAGIIEPCCSQALDYRSQIKADEVLIFADIQVKYANMVMSSVNIEASAKSAENAQADAVIVTATATGSQSVSETAQRVKQVIKTPILIGSGLSIENAGQNLQNADGAIVGACLKQNGIITNTVDFDRVKAFVAAAKGQ